MGMVTGNSITQTFSYDASGNVVSVNYNGTEYYYLRNAQNDIIKLIDGNGNAVVEYKYDSWGKPIGVTGTLANTLGANQPFRYRGYVYDTETGWYYLQSRYYDPSICRFVSADVLLSTGQGVLGHNSYAYCLNNPIRYMDEGGESAAEALSWWTTTMWWLPAIDGIFPAGEIVFGAGILILGVAALLIVEEATVTVPRVSLEEEKDKKEPQKPDVTYPGDDPTKAPGEGFEWRGNGEKGIGEGNWYNPKTGESWHPDLNHPEPIGPHWDYNFRGSGTKGWRVFPNGEIILKPF